jgi:CubicO group peptidase (beta-lactamase class C family)
MKCLVLTALVFAYAVVTTTAHIAQVALATTKPPSASGSPTILDKHVNDTVAQILKEHNVLGYSLVLVRPRAQTKVEYGVWGIRNEDGDPMTPQVCYPSPIILTNLNIIQTLVSLASASKAFTAAAIALLQDDFAHGRNKTSLPAGLTSFNWDTKMHAILPDQLQLMDKWASEKATVHDILAHVSGLPRQEAHNFDWSMKNCSQIP